MKNINNISDQDFKELSVMFNQIANNPSLDAANYNQIADFIRRAGFEIMYDVELNKFELSRKS